MNSLRRFTLGGAIIVAAVSLARAETFRITVESAEVDRAGLVARFELPNEARRAASVRAADGTYLPLQVNGDGTATFIVPAQQAGETLRFSLQTQPPATSVRAEETDGKLVIRANNMPAVVYQMNKEALPRPDIPAKYKRAGYLHPVYTPSGTIVTDDYPAQHVHHHGIWSPWTKTRFQGRTPDFWNMGQETGTVEFVGLDHTWTGPVHGGFVARHRFVDLKGPDGPVAALNETWEVVVYALYDPQNAVTMFDLTSTQTTATEDPLILPEYHYGGLGFRGRGEWLGADRARFLTSEGETDRVKAHASKVRWLHTGGEVDGGTAGLAILGHPENFRAPQPVRVHPKEPFVCFAPSQGGEWKIEPGKPYVARYRFIVADGAPDRARLDAFWNGYATAAVVKLERE